MDTHLASQLEKLNLSPNEAKVYLALFEIGQTSAGELIRKTHLHRSVVYETLDKLIDRKLVFRLTKQNISYYQPADPERILQEIKAQEDVAQDVIPALKSLFETNRPEITVYEGVESYRRFWLDSVKRLPPGAVDYVAGSIGGPWAEYMGSSIDQYFKIAKKRQITWKMIVFDIQDYEQTFLRQYPDFEYQCRLIDKHVSKAGNFNIFGDESVILHSTTEPMIIEVKNKSLVTVFRNLFDILWETGEELPEK